MENLSNFTAHAQTIASHEMGAVFWFWNYACANLAQHIEHDDDESWNWRGYALCMLWMSNGAETRDTYHKV